MKKIKLTRQTVQEFLRFLLLTVAGAALYAVSVNCFTAPNRIAPGGVTGVATILKDVFGTPIGLMILLINIPLFLWGILSSGVRFFGKTIIATLIFSAMIDLTVPFLPEYRGDMMLVALFGGVISGVGLGLTFMGVSRDVVVGMLVPVILPFNLLKAGMNTALTMLLYQAVVTVLRKAHLLPRSEQAVHRRRFSVGVVIAAFLCTVTLLLIALIWGGAL